MAFRIQRFIVFVCTFILFSYSLDSRAEPLQFEAVFIVDGKTTFEDDDTVIIPDPDFDRVEIGDRFIVLFTLDTDQVDSDDSITITDNPVVTVDARHGNFGSLLTAMEITPGPGNSGTFDPSGIAFNPASVSESLDEVAIYKADGAIAELETIRVLTGTTPVPPSLGGSLTDVALNFRNGAALGVANDVNFLDDRSVSQDPFTFDQLFGGPSASNGNGRDLINMTDDVQGSGFSVTNLNRPLSMRFGEAEVIPAIGESFQEGIYIWGTFQSLSVAGDESTEPVPLPRSTVPLLSLLMLMLGFVAIRRMT